MKEYAPRDHHGNRLLTELDIKDLEKEFSVDQTYNPESEKAQSGKAVAEAISPLATKEELGDYVKKTEFEAHTGDTTVHITGDEREKWNKAATAEEELKKEVEEHKADTHVHITDAERSKWDKVVTDHAALQEQFNTHDADTDKHVTVEEKASWADKYTKSEVDSKFEETVEQLEAEFAVDQTYKPESEKAQSGKAVAEAVAPLATKAELSAHAEDTDKHVTPEEKAKWDDKYTKAETDQKLQETVEKLEEEFAVDQTYKPESEKAQSGKAVAEAVAPLATKEELEAHTSDTNVHVTFEEKERWNDTYTQAEVDEKLSLKTDNEDFEELKDRVDLCETSITAEALKNLTTAANLATHVSDRTIHVTEGEKAEWNAKIDQDDLDLQLAEKADQAAIDELTERVKDAEDAIAAEAIKSLATQTALADHVADKDIHVTYEDKTSWGDKYTRGEIDEKERAMDAKKADKSDLEDVKSKIPPAATPENQLADKEFVLQNIHQKHSHFRGSWTHYSDIPTAFELYPADVDGNKKPLRDDYLIVVNDETHEGHTWEYRYVGEWDTNGRDGWHAIFEITSTPLTPDQFAALDSGITKELVEQIGEKADKTELDKYVLTEVQDVAGTSRVYNEATNSGLEFKSSNGDVGAISTVDGKTTGVYAQMTAYNADKSKIVRLEAEVDGLYYTKNAADTAVTPDDEVLVRKDLSPLATKEELQQQKQDLENQLGQVEGGIPDVDQTYNPESTNPQSGTAVKEAVDPLATKEELAAHTSDSFVHTTAEEKAAWADKYTKAEVDAKLEERTSDTEFTELSDRVQALQDTVTAESLKNLATEAELREHKADVDVHVTTQDKEKWNNTYSKEEADAQISELNDRVEALEAVEVDQTYKPESTNAQSGTAVADAFKKHEVITSGNGTAYMANESNGGLIKFTATDGTMSKVTLFDGSDSEHTLIQLIAHNADKSTAARLHFTATGAFYSTAVSGTVSAPENELVVKKDIKDFATNSDVQSLTERVETLEAVEVDQAYNAESSNAQSGTAVADAFRQHEVITTGSGTSYMANESNGGIIKFTKSTGEVGKVTIYDGSDTDNTFVQLSAYNQDKSSVSKIHLTLTGAYYVKTKDGSVAVEDNELVVKKDIKDFATQVALEEHTSNTDIHVTTDDKANWSDKYTKAEVDAKEKALDEKKADKTTVDAIEAKIPPAATPENQLADKAFVANAIRANTAHFRGNWTTYADVPTDTSLYPLDSDQNRVPQRNDYLTVTYDETHENHTWEYRYTGVWATNGKEGWEAVYEISSSPLTADQIAALDSGITSELVQQIPQKADKTELENYVLKEVTDGTGTSHVYNKEEGITIDFVATDGTASGLTVTETGTVHTELSAYNQDKSKHVRININTEGAYYSKNPEDTGTEADNEIVIKKDLEVVATKEELQQQKQDIEEHLTEVEGQLVVVDQSYNAASANPQSGTAVAEAFKQHEVITTGNGTSYMANESNGGIIKFTKSTGEVGKVTLYDGSDDNETFIQLVAHNQDKSSIAKIHVTVSGIYYVKNNDTFVAIDDNELVVKKDIEDFVSTSSLTDLSDRVTALEAITVDQTYNAESENAQSGTAVAEALTPLATKEELSTHTSDTDIHTTAEEKTGWADKYTKTEVDTKLSEVTGRLDTLEAVEVDQTYNGESTNAQSGTAVAEAIKDLATKSEVAEKAAQSDLDTLGGRVDALEAKPDPTVDQTYNAESTNAQSGTAVAEAIAPLATKTELTAHTSDTDIHTTAEEKTGWADKYTKAEVDAKITDVTGRLDTLESIEVDQTYNGESTNAQSGTAVAEAIKDFATQTELSTHTGDTDIHVTTEDKEKWNDTYSKSEVDSKVTEVTERVETLEGVTVDQKYNAQSANAQSGTAVAEAFKQHEVIKDGNNVAYMANETSGGLIKYTKATGEVGKVTVFDGSDTEQTFVQIVAHNSDKSSIAKINVTTTGAYYSTTSGGTVATSDNELVTRKDIKGIASDSTVNDLSDRVEALEAITVDQSYNAESSNAQSGTAVAKAIKDFATKTELSALDTKKADKTTVDAIEAKIPSAASAENQLADKAFVTEAVRSNSADFRGNWHTYADIPTDTNLYPADVDGNKIPGKGDFLVVERDENHENHTWEYRYTGVWDTNGKEGWQAVYEISASPFTSEQLAALDSGITKELTDQIPQKANQSDLDTLDGRVDALEAKPDITVDQVYNAKSANPQSGVAVDDAFKKHITVTTDNGTAYMANETNGGLMKFTKSDGTVGKVTLFDASDNDKTLIQLVAHNQDKSAIAKLNFTTGGAFYSKDSSLTVATADNELVVKKDIKDMATKSALTEVTNRIETLEGVTVDQTYNAESENAQSGTAVAEAISPLAKEADLNTHTRNSEIHITSAERATWNDKYTKGEVDNKIQEVTDRVDDLEAVTVDQTYNGESTNAQSGTAVAEAIAQLATKEELTAHTSDTDIHTTAEEKTGWADKYTKAEVDAKITDVTGRLDALEAVEVDQTYNGESTNAQSGTAVAEAIKDLATKAEVAEKAAQTDLDTLGGRVDALEAKPVPTVDQTYNAESENAQSGTAVAGAIKDLATKAELTEHTGDTDIHTTAEEKTKWADKYTKTETDAKVDEVKVTLTTDDDASITFNKIKFYTADHPAPDLAEREEGVLYLEEGDVSVGGGSTIEVDQTYNAESENAQSGKAVAEAIKDLASKSDIEASKVNVDPEYNKESPNAQSGVAVSQAIDELYELCRFYDGLNTWDIEGLNNLGLYNFTAQTPKDESTATTANVSKVIWFQLGGSYFPKDSYMQQMQIFCRSKLDSAASLDPFYLGMWQEIDGEWKRICTSKNSQTPSDGATLTFNYLPHLIKANAPVRFCPTLHRDSDWPGPDFITTMELNIETDSSSVPANTFLRYDTTSGDHLWQVNFKMAMLDRQSLKLDIPFPTVDQTYNASSSNAQSGKAVAGAIKDLSTKTETDAKVDEVKVTLTTDDDASITFNKIKFYTADHPAPDLAEREEGVLYLEEGDVSVGGGSTIEVDQTYNAESENAQSGKAVAQAVAAAKVVVDQTYNASSANAQSGKAVASAIAAAKQVVDQTYNASSANAQSGKAVASAISGKANTTDLVKLTTYGGSTVTFKSIMFYPNASDAPPLESRTDGVLYLIGE